MYCGRKIWRTVDAAVLNAASWGGGGRRGSGGAAAERGATTATNPVPAAV
jgi:hypothetical protein